jgi:hypothetical protein
MIRGFEFGVFSRGDRGLTWRESAHDLDAARSRAQQLATEEEKEFFVFSFRDATEVARFCPKSEIRNPGQGLKGRLAARSDKLVEELRSA